METLLLVDGSSYLYRAFHALPDLRNRNNEPTGAIYGVLSMLRRLHKDYQADYSACIFDAKGKTFRDELYPEYKSNRPPMPNDLVAQLKPLYECISAMGWPMLIIEGVEADDVIGTLVKQADPKNVRCIISTGDKDIAQLVKPGVTLVNTMTNEILDEAGVCAKFGVPPDRMLDYLALVGDATDNIPGVEKVGPKTAVKWLAQYGSLNNLIAHANEIGGVVGENLRKAIDWLRKSPEILAIKCDVPLPVICTAWGCNRRIPANWRSCTTNSISRPGCVNCGTAWPQVSRGRKACCLPRLPSAIRSRMSSRLTIRRCLRNPSSNSGSHA